MRANPRQSRENPRRDAFPASRTIDPRKSREAAWQAIEQGYFKADPHFGSGIDEEPFPERSLESRHTSGGRSGI